MFKYLAYIKSYDIILNVQAININCIFFGLSNASFANNVKTRYNSQKYCFKFFDDMIDWKANKQKTITISSIEAELFTISMTAKIASLKLLFFKHHSFTLNATIVKQYEHLLLSELLLALNCVMLIYTVTDCVRRFKIRLLISNEPSAPASSQMN